MRLDLSPGISYFFGQLGKAFFALGSHASLLSLAAAFLIAVAFLTLRRYRKGRRIRVKALLRALFPKTCRDQQIEPGGPRLLLL